MSLLAKAPKWWEQRNHPFAYLLAPFGLVYGLVVELRFSLTKPYHSKLPVVCIGNFTVGGGGKTPLAVELANLLSTNGHRPVILTRGYGGQVKGPYQVDLSTDSAVEVGDEPLILAQHAPVVVCADRVKGARFIELMKADVILMDDGFQNPGLHKDLSLIVLDAASGIGNGRIFPAGPLRASLSFKQPRADILVMAGPSPMDMQGTVKQIEERFEGPVLRCDLAAVGDVSWLNGAQISALTGIARPEKFYGSLRQLGALIVEMYEFPDHHNFTEHEAKDILDAAKIDETQIVMTQKDWVRLPETGERGRLRETARVLEVRTKIDEPQKLVNLLGKMISSNSKSAD